MGNEPVTSTEPTVFLFCFKGLQENDNYVFFSEKTEFDLINVQYEQTLGWSGTPFSVNVVPKGLNLLLNNY
jgi:hypothetical protein